MQICPENSAAHLFGGLEKVMVIVPVNADVDKT
jgi:hypothetical protein